MRRVVAAVLASALVLGLQADLAAGKKRAKRSSDRCANQSRCAKVRHRPARAPVERLVDRTQPPAAPAPGEPQGPGPAPPTLPSFVSVSAREFSLTLSRPLVGAGNVRIELRNVGEDPHNLVVSPEDTHTPLTVFSELDPDAYERRTVALQPGRYQLWCSLEFHEGYGMSTTLRVQ